MKLVLKILGGLLAGAVVGALLTAGIIALVDDGSFSFSQAKDVEGGTLALSILYSFLSLFIAFFLNIFLHEAGHLVFGLLTGYRFVSFRVFNVTFSKDKHGQWTRRKFSIPGTAGQCLMAPPTDMPADRVPYFWYNAGGVIVNLLLLLLSIYCLKAFHLPMFLECFFLINSIIALLIALMNGLPIKVGGTNNDGRNIWELWQHPEKRADLIYQLSMVAEIVKGTRMSEMPTEWFPYRPLTSYKDTISLGSKVNYIGWLEDNGRMAEALAETEEVLKHKLPMLILRELAGEAVFLRLTDNPEANIEDVWTKEQQTYTKAMAKYSPGKEQVLFALELLRDGQRKAALQRLEQVKAHWQAYAFPGEARSAIAAMEYVLKKVEENV